MVCIPGVCIPGVCIPGVCIPPGVYREYTGSIPGVYREYTGSIPGVYREYTGSIPGVYREYTKFSEFFQQIFSTNFYLLTIASFRIGVPSILFLPRSCKFHSVVCESFKGLLKYGSEE